jgi:hypothetical protein
MRYQKYTQDNNTVHRRPTTVSSSAHGKSNTRGRNYLRIILHVAAFMNYCCSFSFLGIFGDLIFLMMAVKAEPELIVVPWVIS